MKLFFAVLFFALLAVAADPNQPPANRAAMIIEAGQSLFNLRENVFIYTNGVRVFDPPMKEGAAPTVMTCDWMIARHGPDRKIESIAAHGRVAIDQGDRQARGNQVVYSASNEVMTLTGPFDPSGTGPYAGLPSLSSLQGTNYGTRIEYNRLTDQLRISNVSTIIPQAAISTNKTNSGSRNLLRTPKPEPVRPPR